MAEVETFYWTWPSVAQSFSHSSIETYFFFLMRNLYCFLSPSPWTVWCLQMHIGSFSSGVWFVAVSGECEDYVSSILWRNWKSGRNATYCNHQHKPRNWKCHVLHLPLLACVEFPLPKAATLYPISITLLPVGSPAFRIVLWICTYCFSSTHQKSFRGGE